MCERQQTQATVDNDGRFFVGLIRNRIDVVQTSRLNHAVRSMSESRQDSRASPDAVVVGLRETIAVFRFVGGQRDRILLVLTCDVSVDCAS